MAFFYRSCLLFFFTVSADQCDAESLHLELGSAPGFFLPAARDDLVAAFLGPSARRLQLSLSGVSDAPVLWPGSGFEIALVYRSDIRGPLFGEISFGLGQSQFKAPRGIDIFRDPAIARFRFATLDMRMGTSQTLHEARTGSLQFDVAAGVTFAVVDSLFESALLKVNSRTLESAGLFAAGLIFSPRESQTLPSIRSELVRYSNGVTDVLLAVRLSF